MPTVPPPIRGCVTDPPANPSAASALAALPAGPVPSAAAIVRFEVVPVCSVTAPPATLDGVEVPVKLSIFESKVATLSLTLIWLGPEATPATNVITLPFTVIVLPAAKLAVSESLPDVPDNAVVPLIEPAVGVTWFNSAVPVIGLSEYAIGVPIGSGFSAKSAGLRAPAALIGAG